MVYIGIVLIGIVYIGIVLIGMVYLGIVLIGMVPIDIGGAYVNPDGTLVGEPLNKGVGTGDPGIFLFEL